MKNFDLSPLATFPRLLAASRPVLGTAVVALYAWVVVTAGPGNGVPPPGERTYVELPRVVVIAQRAAPQQAAVASAAVTQVTLQR